MVCVQGKHAGFQPPKDIRFPSHDEKSIPAYGQRPRWDDKKLDVEADVQALLTAAVIPASSWLRMKCTLPCSPATPCHTPLV